jgi:hypothetical protein
MHMRKKNGIKAKRKGRKMILKIAKNRTGYLGKVSDSSGMSVL